MTTLIWQYMLTPNIYFVQQICSVTYLYLLSFHSLRMHSRCKEMSFLCKTRLFWGSGFGVGVGERRFYIRLEKCNLYFEKLRLCVWMFINFFSFLEFIAYYRSWQAIAGIVHMSWVFHSFLCVFVSWEEAEWKDSGSSPGGEGWENDCWSST